MACELKVRNFKNSKDEEVVVSVRQLPASRALELYTELMVKVGASAFAFIEDKYNFGDILVLLRSSQDHKKTSELVKSVVCCANVDGKELKPALFDSRFDGELMLVCKVFSFVLEVNFKDFFMQGIKLNEQRLSEAEETSATEEQKNLSE
ncbi:tail assembly chaperone [Proteus phage Myduc]|uniref:Uncharacterized protein n=1 Tax=Proteus phage Myduc TaxID=2650874 RepID=A0A5J6TAZ0_9CAUD|nr:tail assembly chaperone [Proteus phage Myduc]QFG06686.1 hypothetical protein CPT_Myduc_064 [Proteus phage Myduc]